MEKLSYIILSFFIAVLFLCGCEKEEPPLPEVSTGEITEVTAFTARSGGTVNSDGGTNIIARGVCWSTDPDPVITDSKTTNGTGVGGFNSLLTGLTPSTKYYIRAYATNNDGTGYGIAFSFTTLDGLVGTLTTTEVTEITAVSAKSGGNITSDGGAPITARGVVWSNSLDPTIDEKLGFTTDGRRTGAFSSVLKGLTPATTYYVRSYATNAVTTKYGMSLSFTTLGQKPSATTLSPSEIGTTTARLNGIVNANELITVVGFEYGLTTDYGSMITAIQSPVSGNEDINVSAVLADLSAGTVYHFRVKAENELGVTYGNDKTFTIIISYDSRDGKAYKTVTIGNQVWMAENLAYLPSVVGPNTGSNTAPYHYVYGYNGTSVSYAKTTTNYQTYGVLYNWPAAMQACPTGWHFPTDAEWTTMENYLIANGYNFDGTTTGNKIAKSMATSNGWDLSSNTGAIGNPDYPDKQNVTGLSALPGGYRSSSGFFNYIGSGGYWWSATEYGADNVWARYLRYDYSDVYRGNYYEELGFYVRCLRD